METYKLYRTNAPQTSVDAAEQVDTNRLEPVVLEVIASFNDGCISDEVRDEVQRLHGITSYSSVTARYSSLEEKGKIIYTGITRPGKSGRGQRIMMAVRKKQEPEQGRLI